MRSRRNLPRKRSRTKLGATPCCSGRASATPGASAALTLGSGAAVMVMAASPRNLSALTAHRLGGDSPRLYRRPPMHRSLRLAVAVVWCTPLAAQTPKATAPQQVLIKAGRLIDGRSDAPQSGVWILVEGDRIQAVGPLARLQGPAKTARGGALASPAFVAGFIDAHTHLLLQGDPTAQSYNEQLLYQSTPYRA